MPNSEPYIIFTDGACLGNPGPGGYGWTMLTPSETIYESGGAQENTTNNRMEMMAVLKVLEFIPSDAYTAKIHSDSSYVLKGIQEWRHGWKARDWRTAAGDEVANLDISSTGFTKSTLAPKELWLALLTTVPSWNWSKALKA